MLDKQDANKRRMITKVNSAPYLPLVMSDVVIDISHYENVSQDFVTTARSGITAVILKATQGIGFIDPTFLPRVSEAKAAGLLVGAYHFLDSSSPSQQMAHFLTVAVHEAGVNWLALDWEPYPQSQASVMSVSTAAAAIRAEIGRWPVLYTIRSMLAAPNTVLSNCPLWLAEYGTRPICPPGFPAWQLWQHTDGQVGSNVVPVPGIGPCDRSKFAGTVRQLKTWWYNPIPIVDLSVRI
jgi:lysozyme